MPVDDREVEDSHFRGILLEGLAYLLPLLGIEKNQSIPTFFGLFSPVGRL
jgi:hypothetical protein